MLIPLHAPLVLAPLGPAHHSTPPEAQPDECKEINLRGQIQFFSGLSDLFRNTSITHLRLSFCPPNQKSQCSYSCWTCPCEHTSLISVVQCELLWGQNAHQSIISPTVLCFTNKAKTTMGCHSGAVNVARYCATRVMTLHKLSFYSPGNGDVRHGQTLRWSTRCADMHRVTSGFESQQSLRTP
jgi:hypothetical protein